MLLPKYCSKDSEKQVAKLKEKLAKVKEDQKAKMAKLNERSVAAILKVANCNRNRNRYCNTNCNPRCSRQSVNK